MAKADRIFPVYRDAVTGGLLFLGEPNNPNMQQYNAIQHTFSFNVKVDPSELPHTTFMIDYANVEPQLLEDICIAIDRQMENGVRLLISNQDGDWGRLSSAIVVAYRIHQFEYSTVHQAYRYVESYVRPFLPKYENQLEQYFNAMFGRQRQYRPFVISRQHFTVNHIP
ncbi:hypothetical protein FA95DRAFT_1574277 [Auriscalpium vulgare]|uniref:Uncharacterized protein n=1 Tax=Auriscalpium vulgare TaxID=40419 RepID=A0ACB8RMH8_9AGAM|nr:hypothetical protein FA95DRAFT_1574277 [Auriscalpium vulgare]